MLFLSFISFSSFLPFYLILLPLELNNKSLGLLLKWVLYDWNKIEQKTHINFLVSVTKKVLKPRILCLHARFYQILWFLWWDPWDGPWSQLYHQQSHWAIYLSSLNFIFLMWEIGIKFLHDFCKFIEIKCNNVYKALNKSPCIYSFNKYVLSSFYDLESKS